MYGVCIRCQLNPGVTGGDAWLEHKGKRPVASAEAAQGRNGLMEIIQQSSNPYVDGRAMGDAWLSAGGKKRVPGKWAAGETGQHS